ncbi:hypothetical protein LVY72_24080 [Arthrobacter sp. I2-34]|uniref:AbiEi antitoxin N-terminal domain-containing protein n=1 Tax=Arthrobacter hankyongi TaxID=2904801 RepID=A0ABS9LE89_9MICC|nr:type IV toxin-antitoxin system AbiEi family antitoxin domain-containing protein [Arthrobacter hankyongi]MCG2624971.1 hypothetical protein [Arthrobacter hankyongi]
MDTLARMIERVRRLGGTARVSDLLAAGTTDRVLAKAVDSGLLVRIKRGLVALPDADPVVRHALVAGGLITCVSAVKEHGLWGMKDPESLHLWVPHGHPVAAQRHRGYLAGRRLPGAYVPVLDTVLHALRCRPPLEALVIAESAVRLGRVIVPDLLGNLKGPRNGPVRDVVGRIGFDAESPLEVIARELFRSVGLQVETQVRIEGVGRVDLLVEGHLIVELDGFDFHWTRTEFRKDRRRNNAGVLSGLPTLRYIYEDLMFDADRVVAEVARMARRSA